MDVQSQNAHTYLDLVQTGPYIDNLGEVIGSITPQDLWKSMNPDITSPNGYVSYNR